MSQKGLSKPMKQEILKLSRAGLSPRKIARALNISKNTAKKYIMEPQEVEFKSQQANTEPWECILKELQSGKATIKQLWTEHSNLGLSYWSFTRQIRQLKKNNQNQDITIVRTFKAGEYTEVDYADGIPITDRETGLKTKTQLFCGVLNFSKKTFGEFTWSQKRSDFLASHNRMWGFFGGVSQYLVVDNLKAGVNKAHRYDPEVNQTYCDYARHMGFVVQPARPRKPRDKANVENAIGVIQRQFYSEVRNKTFYSLNELNVCFREYLGRLNAAEMSDYGVSRDERFVNEVKLLKPLPPEEFEIRAYKQAKVHLDCHVQVEGNYYSVTYPYVGQTVLIKICSELIEIFNSDYQSIGVHLRLKGKGEYSTNEQHYPEQKTAIARFDLAYAKKAAEKVGPKTFEMVQHLFNLPGPLQYLRRIQGLLRLNETKTISTSAIEFACTQALIFQNFKLEYIKRCALSFDQIGQRPDRKAPVRNLESIYLHSKQTTP